MNKETIDKVSAILTNNGIEHVNANHSIFISRSSIVNKISGKHENDSYDELITILNNSFNARFTYVTRTDKLLQLDMLSTGVPI